MKVKIEKNEKALWMAEDGHLAVIDSPKYDRAVARFISGDGLFSIERMASQESNDSGTFYFWKGVTGYWAGVNVQTGKASNNASVLALLIELAA